MEKHQYLDDCIFSPNAHDILCPGNIYGLSSEVTNWICHPAHRENVWSSAAHHSRQGWQLTPQTPIAGSEHSAATWGGWMPRCHLGLLSHLPPGQPFASALNLHGTFQFVCCGSTQRGSRNRGQSVGAWGTQIPHDRVFLSLMGLRMQSPPSGWEHTCLSTMSDHFSDCEQERSLPFRVLLRRAMSAPGAPCPMPRGAAACWLLIGWEVPPPARKLAQVAGVPRRLG